MNNCWIMNDKCFTSPSKDWYGFIYKITDPYGKVYFGKKAFEHKQKKVLSKKARKLSGTRKRIERTTKDSGWLNYWGSSRPFLEFLESSKCHNFCTREIIKLCKDKSSLAYWEMAIMVQENVLFREDCWNANISGRYFKGKIKE